MHDVSLSPETHVKHIYFPVSHWWVAVLVLNSPNDKSAQQYLSQYLVYRARLSLLLNRLL